MNLPGIGRRPFPVADRTREGDLYRHMHPRLAAIDLLRNSCADGRAGVDVYDPTVFILDAHPHETVWARRCLLLCGLLLGERQLERGRIRYRGILDQDVRAELDLNEVPPRYVIRDEPLASRAVAADDLTPSIVGGAAYEQLLKIVQNADGMETARGRASARAELVRRYPCQDCGACAGHECYADFGCIDSDRRPDDETRAVVAGEDAILEVVHPQLHLAASDEPTVRSVH